MYPSEVSNPNKETNRATKPLRRRAWKKPFLIFLILIICASYPKVKIRWAKHGVQDFCSHISIGMSVQGLEQRAKDCGLKGCYLSIKGLRLIYQLCNKFRLIACQRFKGEPPEAMHG